MKESNIKWIGTIPNNWMICRIKDVANLYTGNSIKDDEKKKYMDSTEARPYIATKDVEAIIYTANYENGLYVKLDDTSFKIAKSGSTLMCIEGGSAGKKKTLLDRDVSFVNKLCCFEPKDVDGRFLFYFLCSPNFEEEFEKNLSGLIGGVSVSNLRTIQFVKPSTVEEQIQIADYLDSECEKIDCVIRETKKTIEEYKNFRRSVITQIVTQGLQLKIKTKNSNYQWIGEIPENWEEIRIKWLLEERKERSETGTEEPLSMSQKYGLIPTKDMDSVPNMASSFVGAKIVHKGDLVFNKLKAHLGVFAVSEYEGLVSPDYAVYYSTGRADMRFLEFLFKTPQYICEFKKKSSGVGAGLTRLYTKDLFSIYCALPPMEEQEEIVTKIIDKVTAIDEIIKEKEHIIEEMQSYKKSLIYETITGKRRVV